METSSAFFPKAELQTGSNKDWLDRSVRDLISEAWGSTAYLDFYNSISTPLNAATLRNYSMPLSARSQSKWFVRINRKCDRYPYEFLEADCLGNHTCGSCPSGQTAQSEPITVSMVVAVREGSTSEFQREDLAVGCTCTCQ